MIDHSTQALEHAVQSGDARRVAALLDAGPALLNARFPDNLDLTPLMWACRNRREAVVADLIARGANANLTNRPEADGDGGNTALWFTGQGEAGGTVGIARRLLDAGADIDRRCEHGRTALYVAATWVHDDLVRLLIDRGADPAVPDDDGRTPLVRLRADLLWCARQPSLNAVQQKFDAHAPTVIAYLESVAGR